MNHYVNEKTNGMKSFNVIEPLADDRLLEGFRLRWEGWIDRSSLVPALLCSLDDFGSLMNRELPSGILICKSEKVRSSGSMFCFTTSRRILSWLPFPLLSWIRYCSIADTISAVGRLLDILPLFICCDLLDTINKWKNIWNCYWNNSHKYHQSPSPPPFWCITAFSLRIENCEFIFNSTSHKAFTILSRRTTSLISESHFGKKENQIVHKDTEL